MVEQMRQNPKYSNGDIIGTTIPATLDISSESEPRYQWAYDGDESHVDTYGRLYTWHVIVDERNVCPAGWHVSTYDDWELLLDNLGEHSTPSALLLKEAGWEHWVISYSTNATDVYGFTALPGGLREPGGIFKELTKKGYWFTSATAYNVWMMMYAGDDRAFRYGVSNSCGASFRCVKD